VFLKRGGDDGRAPRREHGERVGENPRQTCRRGMPRNSERKVPTMWFRGKYCRGKKGQGSVNWGEKIN